MSKIFCTLGPTGTCHENATKHYIHSLGIAKSEILYILDFVDAADLLANNKVDYVIQNCAHPQVAILNAGYYKKIFIADAFVFPTKPMGILYRPEMMENRTLALMPATKGYINADEWDKVVEEISNPIVGQKLLAGEYSYGVTFIEYAEKHKDTLKVYEDFGGPVDTAWIVYKNKHLKLLNNINTLNQRETIL